MSNSISKAYNSIIPHSICDRGYNKNTASDIRYEALIRKPTRPLDSPRTKVLQAGSAQVRGKVISRLLLCTQVSEEVAKKHIHIS